MNALQTVKSATKNLAQVVIKNEPSILAYSAMGGVVTTGILAAKGGMDYVHEEQSYISDGKELDNYQRAGIGIKCFWPAILNGLVDIGLIFATNRTHLARNAALLALAATREDSFKKYKEQAEKVLGPKKTEALSTAIAKEQIEDINRIRPEVESTGTGDQLCYDPLEGRRFRATRSAIVNAVAETNRLLMLDNGATLNQFYDILNLEDTKLGDYVGWDVDHPARLDFAWADGADGEPCLVIKWINEPRWCFR